MIKLIKPCKGDYCWSISKATLKEFSEVRVIVNKTGEAIIKTKTRGYTNRKRRNNSAGVRIQSPKIRAARKATKKSR